jgi:hypothetical protein
LLLNELGYTEKGLLEIEKSVGDGLLQCDIYIGGDIDIVIDIHGPLHYKAGTKEPIDSALYVERLYRKYHKRYLAIPYDYYDTILTQGEDFNLKI